MTTMGLIRKPKQRKPHKTASPALQHCPQKGAIVKKSFITTPRKPNSAKRKVAKVFFRKNRKVVDIYLEGMDFNKLNPHSVVLVRGRGPRDVPGVRYHAIRGQGDFPPLLHRRKGRSKYGAKRPKIPQPDKKDIILTKLEKEKAYRFLNWNIKRNPIFKRHLRVKNRY
jgi:small subunit ribosomal protein S12